MGEYIEPTSLADIAHIYKQFGWPAEQVSTAPREDVCMYVCMYIEKERVLMYVCIYIHTYIEKRGCMYVCMYVYRKREGAYVCMYIHTYVHRKREGVCMYVCMYIEQERVYVCMYVYRTRGIHTYVCDEYRERDLTKARRLPRRFRTVCTT